MAIGYASKTIGVPNTQLSNIKLASLTEEKLCNNIRNNLIALDNILDYNIFLNIKLFRISSDVIPFASHPANKIDWIDEFNPQLINLGEKIINSQMRVSMHPGQYTVLNSNSSEVRSKAVADLNYHCAFLDCLGVDNSNKIILHVGGVYNNKIESINRFVNQFQDLDPKVQKRIVIENDDNRFNVADVLYISSHIDAPVVFDSFHHFLNPPGDHHSQNYWISKCQETWQTKDGKQKIHYSQFNAEKRRGSHSDTIKAQEFLAFYHSLKNYDIDIMLEVKDKNLSAVKCINLICNKPHIKNLEKEWARYKYYVLSKDNNIYNSIRQLLKNKNEANALEFYDHIENAISLPEHIGAQINAAQHIWGYINNGATDNQKKRYFSLIDQYQKNQIRSRSLKNHLYKCASIQDQKYLLNSLYFYI